LQFLVVTRRRSDAFPVAAWTRQLLEEEAEHVRALYLEGSIRAIWRRNDEPGAILIFEANTQDQVEQIMADLPLRLNACRHEERENSRRVAMSQPHPCQPDGA
jgi:muconolactone delta-isomerase